MKVKLLGLFCSLLVAFNLTAKCDDLPLNPKACVSYEFADDACPDTEIAYCPTGPCVPLGVGGCDTGIIQRFFAFYYYAGSNSKISNPVSVASGMGAARVPNTGILCYARKFCFCEENENNVLVCVESSYSENYFIYQYTVQPGIICPPEDL